MSLLTILRQKSEAGLHTWTLYYKDTLVDVFTSEKLALEMKAKLEVKLSNGTAKLKEVGHDRRR